MSDGHEALPSGDCATVTVYVAVLSCEDAFEVFTREIRPLVARALTALREYTLERH